MKSTIWLAAIALMFFLPSCVSHSESFEPRFSKEFYLVDRECFGRYFYQNDINGHVEYELYCSNGEKFQLTETADSVFLVNDLENTHLSIEDFYAGFGKPVPVKELSVNEISFSIDTLKSVEDTSMLGEKGELHKINIQIRHGSQKLFDRVYKCNKLIEFDSNNISVYHPITHSDIYIVDGIESCLVMEMAYYDQEGEFAGWERLTADIKTIVNTSK